MSYPLQKVPIDLLLYKRFPLIFKDFHDIKDFTMGISKISKLPGAGGLVFVRARCSHSCVFRRGSCAQPQRPGPDNEETIYSHPVSYLMVL
jgi:hypothetical protein